MVCRPELAEVYLRAARFGGQPSREWESEGWAHFAFTRINIEPTILRKKIENLPEAGALMLIAVEGPDERDREISTIVRP